MKENLNNSNNIGAGDTDDVLIDLMQYWEIIRKRLWIVAITTAIGLTGMTLWLVRQPKVYEAVSSVVISPEPPSVLGSRAEEVNFLGAGNYWSNQEYYNTQVEIIRKYSLLRLTASRPASSSKVLASVPIYRRMIGDGMSGKQKEKDDNLLLDQATESLARSVISKQDMDSRIVKIFVRNTDPELAVDIVNAHIDTYLEFTLGLKTDGSGGVSRFLSDELHRAQSQLQSAEKALYEYRKENNILNIDGQSEKSILSQNVIEYSEAYRKASIKRKEIAILRNQIQKLRNQDVLTTPLFGLLDRQEIATSLKDQLSREKQKLSELSEEVGPKHVDFKKQYKKIEEITAALSREANVLLREVEERYQRAVATEKLFSSDIDRLKREVSDFDKILIEYNRLRREHESAERNHNLLMGRLSTSDISGRNKTTNVKRHEMARTADRVGPRYVLNLLLSLLLSSIFGIGLVVLLDYLDRTIKSAEDVKRFVGAPLLGVIPVVSEEEIAKTASDVANGRDLYVFRNPTSRTAECCRSIRTNILFSSAEKRMVTITLSSPRPRDGKTTSTMYLGTTMAQSGQRVLLIDTDLRRPRLHNAAGVEKNRGITNLILGNASYEDCILQTEIPNLEILPSGPIPPNPAELLLTNRFRTILKELEGRYDRILLDSPPILAVTDAVVLARITDGVILIAQAGKTSIDDVKQCSNAIRDVDATILGMVLNTMDIGDKRYGSYHYYHYGYDSKDSLQAA